MAQTVVGIFDNASEAQTAVQQLVSNGFSRDHIDISSRSEDMDRTAGTTNYDRNDDDDSIGGFFRSLFGGNDDDDYRKYSTVGRRGSIVTVHTQTVAEAERAADILDQYGAVDVNDRATQYGYSGSYNNTATSTADTTIEGTTATSSTADITTEGTTSIPVIEEQLNVGKRVVQTGGVRLRSRIFERPVEETLRLREERVHVNRTPVNRPATEADLNSFREGTIEMTEQAEVPVVGKEARIVEEVSLSKDVEEREETIRDTVRHTDVDVENMRTDEDRLRTDRTTYDTDQTDRTGRTYDADDDLNRPGTL